MPQPEELAVRMTEKELARNVVHAAKTLGWRVYFTYNSLHSPKGWPDLVLLRAWMKTIYHGNSKHPEFGTSVIYAELKREKGKLTPEQEETLELLRGTGHGVYVWRPSNWVSGEIAEILASKSEGLLDPIAGSYAGTFADWEGK